MTNEIIDFVRTVAPLGKWAIVLTIVLLLRKRPESGSIMDLLTEQLRFVLLRRRARGAGHGKQKAYELAQTELADRREVEKAAADVVPIEPKRRKLPARRARDPSRPA